jgi:hypothetical protein
MLGLRVLARARRGRLPTMRTVSYASTRGEIWRRYWRAWARPAGLWRVHAVLALVA